MEIKIVYGAEINNYITDLARLRIKVFYDFPYLYEGDAEYEENYLKIYTQTPESVMVLAIDNHHPEYKIVGAASALPLKDEADYVQAPFYKNEMDINHIYYFGESVLLNEYRGRGLGHQFFDGRESAALRFSYNIAAFCAVIRDADHPKRPKNYRPLDDFWIKRGYEKRPELVTEFSWKDRDDLIESKKKMMFWMKKLV